MKSLVLFYSLTNGNTKRIAEMIKKEKNSDIEQIDTVIPYPDDYDTVVSQGQDEVNRGYTPEIKALKSNLNDYDVIYIGTPTWWYTMAPAIHTLLKEYNFSGKTVIPFMTCGGWPGHVIKDMKKLLKNSNVPSSMEVTFDSNGGDKLVTPIEDIIKEIKNFNK